MTTRAFYSATIKEFLEADDAFVLGQLVHSSAFDVETTQRDAWLEELRILKSVLTPYARRGKLYLEYSVPRLGKRIDAVVVVDHVVFVIEFKVGETKFTRGALDQVCDYVLDLKNFHETSHDKHLAPILVATRAPRAKFAVVATPAQDGVLFPICASPLSLGQVFDAVLDFTAGETINANEWEQGRYCPTPTIIEAAMALYRGHSVAEISRSDASATNLSLTSDAIADVIESSRTMSRKSICFVTGVPGAGKTLVGLNIATKYIDKKNESHSVYLSGNGPLVSILREALARDRVQREREAGRRMSKTQARSEVQLFVQNVHHFRDDCLADVTRPPLEHVVLFDEAQRAWNQQQTATFMLRKKNKPDFCQSEPEFLISCLDRHSDWAVVVCLVGGGQEIHVGEAGIGEWIDSILRSFPDWYVYLSSRLHDSEYGAGAALRALEHRDRVTLQDELHLGVSMRSFRAERVSTLVKQLLDLEEAQAEETLREMGNRYPILITRDIKKAKAWLRHKARGSERYGMIVSSQAQRLKPHAIDVRSPVDPIHWFLDGKEDVRSSYYLEDVVTEFQVQGLELDWACVTWDGDFRYSASGWQHFSFVGDRWNRVLKAERRMYLKNAYRVLLTRARQGMVIVVPQGDPEDPTRHADHYDPTFEYLRRVGFAVLG